MNVIGIGYLAVNKLGYVFSPKRLPHRLVMRKGKRNEGMKGLSGKDKW